jgi:hypothetical protein
MLAVRPSEFRGAGPIPSVAVVLSLDNHLKRLRFGRASEGLVGIEDFIELEMMSNQELGVDLVTFDGLEQHRNGGGVDQPCGDGDVAVPQAL